VARIERFARRIKKGVAYGRISRLHAVGSRYLRAAAVKHGRRIAPAARAAWLIARARSAGPAAGRS
jgi:hypothetical protein